MFISNLIAAVAGWRKYRVAVRDLAALDDRALRDIGINRSQIKRVAWQGR